MFVILHKQGVKNKRHISSHLVAVIFVFSPQYWAKAAKTGFDP